MADESWAYYHSLYHLVTHWAAFVGVLALLITIGVVISASPKLGNRWYFVFAIISGTLAAFYFLGRMRTFGNSVLTKLEEFADESTLPPVIGFPWNLLVGAIVVVGITVLDFIALCRATV